MTRPETRELDQAQLWNGPSGRAWVEAQELLDDLLRPFEPILEAAVASAPSGVAVLDVGCGTGATTLALARRIGGEGRAVGVDVSAPMLEVARTRALGEGSPAQFVLADAETFAFQPATFDVLVSRFGVMFFPDPKAAFANLRRAAKPGGLLHAVVWRSAADNAFMTTAERAAAPLLALPPRNADGPGQFAFGDPDRVRAILAASGWRSADLRPLDVPLTISREGLRRYVSLLGPVGHAVRELDEGARARVLDTVFAAFEPFFDGDRARFAAACWLVSAHA